jgi:hypothetical protein
MPGTNEGIYTVTAMLQGNACGPGVEAPSPWKFNVELSQQASTLFWNSMDGSPLLQGEIASSAVSMTNSTDNIVDSTADGGPGPCEMNRHDVLTLDLTGSPPRSFTGTLTYTFSVDTGSDCSDQMRSAGGQYTALPCTVSYTLSGSN